MYNDGFSEFEIKESSIKVGDDEAFEKIGCVGTAEETLNIRLHIYCCGPHVQCSCVSHGSNFVCTGMDEAMTCSLKL